MVTQLAVIYKFSVKIFYWYNCCIFKIAEEGKLIVEANPAQLNETSGCGSIPANIVIGLIRSLQYAKRNSVFSLNSCTLRL